MIHQIFSILSIFFSFLFSGSRDNGKFILISGLAGLLLASAMLWATWTFSSTIGLWISDWIPWEWAKQAWFFRIIIAVSGLIVLYMVFRYLLLILLSPLLSYISEKVEYQAMGYEKQAEFSLARSAIRSVRVNGRNIIREVIISILLLFLSFMPLLNFLAIPSLILVQSYFTGFGFMDYHLERHLNFKETVIKVRRHKWAAITLGIIFICLIMIPVLGQVFGPYLCTVTATRYFCLIELRAKQTLQN